MADPNRTNSPNAPAKPGTVTPSTQPTPAHQESPGGPKGKPVPQAQPPIKVEVNAPQTPNRRDDTGEVQVRANTNSSQMPAHSDGQEMRQGRQGFNPVPSAPAAPARSPGPGAQESPTTVHQGMEIRGLPGDGPTTRPDAGGQTGTPGKGQAPAG